MADYIRGLGAEKCHLTFFGHFQKKKKKKKTLIIIWIINLKMNFQFLFSIGGY